MRVFLLLLIYISLFPVLYYGNGLDAGERRRGGDDESFNWVDAAEM